MILCEQTVALLWGFCIQFLAFHPPNVDSLWGAKVQLVSPLKKTWHIHSAKAKVGVQKWYHSGWATNQTDRCWVNEQEKLTVTNTSLKHKLAQRKRIKEGAGRAILRSNIMFHKTSNETKQAWKQPGVLIRRKNWRNHEGQTACTLKPFLNHLHVCTWPQASVIQRPAGDLLPALVTRREN